MQSKKKVYQLKPTLRGDEAIEYLSELIDSPVDEDSFRTLAFVNSLKVFVSTAEIDTADLECREINTGNEVIPLGLNELLGGLSNIGIKSTDFGFDLELDFYSGPHKQPHIYKFKGPADTNGEIVIWHISLSANREAFRSFGAPLIFKPTDIQALADKLNAESTAPTKRGDDAEAGSLNRRPAEADLDPRERKSLYRLIAALLSLAKLPERDATKKVENKLQKMGFGQPQEERIRHHLKEALRQEPDE